RYGGFETFAEELSTRLAKRGHQVTVYCRERNAEPTYRGVRLQYLPTIRHKYFDTIAHTALSTLHVLGSRYEALLYCNAANAVLTWVPNAVVTDAQAIAAYYREKYRRDSVMIPYGAEVGTVKSAGVLEKLGLE